MDEQLISNSLQAEGQPEVVVVSPYPREVVAAPLFKPWYQRVGVDLVSVGLGWSIGGVHPSHPHAVELNVACAIIGLLWARWLQRRDLGAVWRTIAFGIAGIVVGRVFLPPKLPDGAGNHSERVFDTTFLFYFVAIGVAAVTRVYLRNGAMFLQTRLDWYETVRASVGRLSLYPLPLMLVITVLPPESSPVLPVLLTLILMIVVDVYLSYRRALTRAAVWAICWTPIGVAGLAYLPMSGWFPLQGAALVLAVGLGFAALVASILLPVSEGRRDL